MVSPAPDPRHPAPSATLGALRRLLLAILLMGVIGTGIELVLLEHTEDVWQLVPLGLLGLSLIVIGWHLARRGAAGVRALQTTMLLFVMSGVAGLILHYRGNVEFELEMYPSLSGLALFRDAMAGATPALAPGTMIQLGLLGLAYAYRHPALAHLTEDQPPTSGH